MRILIVNKFLYPNGGSETYIFKIGEELKRMGHEVQYFGMEHEGRIVGNHAESYTSDMDFHSGGMQKLLYPFKILYSAEARRKIRAVLEDFQPEIVHLNNINFQITPSVIDEIRAWNPGTRIVYTAHDYQWICPNHMMKIPATGELCDRCQTEGYGACFRNRCIHNSRMRSLLGMLEAILYEKKTYQKVDCIICPSEFMNRQLSQNAQLRGRTVTCHNFLNLAHEKTDYSAVLTLPTAYALYFGRYDQEKGIATLLKVCRQLPEVQFVFAGKGELEAEVSQVQNVQNVGFQTGAELIHLIRNAQFVIFPSEWYENCPFSVMEAQMYGVPVLASDLGGTPELVQDGITGELFHAGDAEQLREKIRQLWYNMEQRTEYKDACMKIAGQAENGNGPFDTLETYCRKLVDIYRK